jgi:hypothetical protein
MRYYVQQRSPEWFELRLGMVTSTRMKTVARGTLAAQTKLLDLMQWEVDYPDKALEKNIAGFGYKTPSAIRLGKEREDWLIARFEIKRQLEFGKKIKLDRPGFVRHPTIPEFGCSPDWLLADRSGEGKVRVDQTKHEFAMKYGLLPEDKDQVYCQMMCAGFTEADYVSYCPDYPVIESRHCIVEVKLDQMYANFLYAELNRFLKHFRAGTRPTVKINPTGVPSFFD